MKATLIFKRKIPFLILLLIILILPLLSPPPYLIHIVTFIFIWSYITTVWSYMGRFHLVSLGHGAFLGIGAYVSILFFNHHSLSPWIGMLLGGIGAALLALILGYACFRFGVVGDYFALVTLALGEVVALVINAFRDVTGGSLGMTLKGMGTSFYYFQFEKKIYFYYISFLFLLFALFIWQKIDRSRIQKALHAIGEDEIAAASIGIRIIRYKLFITLTSAFLTATGGVLYAQYMTYVNPETLSGVGVSLAIPFKAILGGMFHLWGSTIGTAMIVSLEEYIRIMYGAKFMGISQVFYGILLVVLIIFLPKGLYGTLSDYWQKRRGSV
jgi:branched-chain amino acid transport system permease protein